MTYDSYHDTQEHINKVRENIGKVQDNLLERALYHDESKLSSPEKEVFDRVTPRLKELTYGSDEYKEQLADMKVALDHHYAANSHHPEHYENGVNGMSLLDVLEMLADWKAATERHTDGNLSKSMDINKERFDISDQLYEILLNTAKELGWLD